MEAWAGAVDFDTQSSIDAASRKTLEQMRMAACCFVPLRTSGRLIGVLNASARFPTEFSQEDTRLLRIVGNGIAVVGKVLLEGGLCRVFWNPTIGDHPIPEPGH